MALYTDFTFPTALDPAPSANATITTATVAITAGSLLSANANRKGFSVRNTSNRVIYLGFATTVSVTSGFFISIPANGYFEWSFNSPYTGAIFAIANGAGATAQVMELLP
jgi:hypothetical protein